MLKLEPDRKRFLITQHRESEAASTPARLRQNKTGPELGSDLTVSSLKRFSLVNWAVGSVEDETAVVDRNIPLAATSAASTFKDSPQTPRSPVIGEAGSSWTSWWSTASNATGTGQNVGESKDTPSFYVTELRST